MWGFETEPEFQRELDWIDRLAGVRTNPNRIGDETSGAIVTILKEYLCVPVASH